MRYLDYIVDAVAFLWTGILILVLVGCATYVPVIRVPAHGGVLAHTVCDEDGRLAILIYEEASEAGLKYLRAHEQEHVRQVQAYGDCREFMRVYEKDRKVQLYAEAGAECAAYNLRKSEPNFDPSIGEYLLQSFRAVYSEASEEDLAEALHCLGEPWFP